MRILPLATFLGLSFIVLPAHSEPAEPQTESPIETFVDWFLEDKENLQSVAFAEVIQAVSGCEVLPVVPEDAVDAEMLTVLTASLDTVLAELSVSGNPIHQVGRVNEISRHLENALMNELNQHEGYQCEVPLNASGKSQRSGYPDLRLLHEASGRVFYIDPKVYKQGSEDSSFRTFYYEPQRATNKVLDDASHLIVGVAHSGKQEGMWRLDGWKLVDLVAFRVRLKAEFQASNKQLYKESRIIGESE